MAKDDMVMIRCKLLEDDNTIKAIANLLKIDDPDTVIGKLTRFWGFVTKNSTDGMLYHMTSVLIDQYLRCDGFANAYATVGWGEIKLEGYKINGWDKYLSPAARERQRKAQNQANCRARKKLQNVEQNSDSHQETVTCHQETVTNHEQQAGLFNEPSDIAEYIELWGKGKVQLNPQTGEWVGIDTDLMSVWQKAYPAVNLAPELNKAAAWCINNPKRGRKSNYTAFLGNWLSRCQDRGGNSPDDLGGNFGPRTPPRSKDDNHERIRQADELRRLEMEASEQGEQ